jgi:hypothetical protein
MTEPTKPQGQPSRDPEAIRKKVLADPNTEQIAKNLGVPLEDYVNQVVHFVLHPNEDPNIYIVEDEDLRAMGLEPPNAEEMGRFVMNAATEATAIEEAKGSRTEFVEARKDPVRLQDPRAASSGETMESKDPHLKTDLEKQVRTTRGDSN